MTVAPPTIADLQTQGVAGAWVTCCNPVCLRSTFIAFAAIGLAPETPFRAIAASRRVDVSADWRGLWTGAMITKSGLR